MTSAYRLKYAMKRALWLIRWMLYLISRLIQGLVSCSDMGAEIYNYWSLYQLLLEQIDQLFFILAACLTINSVLAYLERNWNRFFILPRFSVIKLKSAYFELNACVPGHPKTYIATTFHPISLCTTNQARCSEINLYAGRHRNQ